MTHNYDSTKDIAREIRTELKQEFPDCKFSVTSDYNQIIVALMSAPASPWENGQLSGYEQLNHYYLDDYLSDHLHYGSWEGVEYLTPDAIKMLKQVDEISNRKNWDESEIQIDYFHCHYYFCLHIGKWDKNFEVTR